MIYVRNRRNAEIALNKINSYNIMKIGKQDDIERAIICINQLSQELEYMNKSISLKMDAQTTRIHRNTFYVLIYWVKYQGPYNFGYYAQAVYIFHTSLHQHTQTQICLF